ncbi:MAG: methyl-accepting chemotaxis protein [Selenomonadaceae bacterium]|nr:methyl-accepting chemotaxis protein [Selenomonadaceae bacterium]
MDTLTIRQKLFLVFGLLIAIFVCNGIYTGYSLNSINDGALRIATEHLQGVMAASESNHAVSDYRQGEYAVVTATTLPNRIQAAQQNKKLADQIDITFDSLEPKLSADIATDFKEMRAIWESYKKNSTQLVALAKNNRIAEATKLLEASKSDYAKINAKLTRIVDNRKDFIHQENVDAERKYDTTKVTLIISILFVALLSGFMAFYLSSSIYKSIQYLMDVSHEVSNGNLTVDASSASRDEFGTLTNAYGETIQNLRTLIRQIQQTANEVSSFAEQLTESASQSALATQQVASSIGNVASNTSNQGAAVNKSTGDIREMASSLQGFEEKASASAEAARSVEGIAASGKEAIDNAVSQMSEIADSVTSSADVIQKLAERSTEIGQISDTISSIAEQTNLLSLNATIEAARAGEAGRGFSVVAEEVRKLAEGSGIAAQKIAKLIHSIQQDTENAVKRMQKGTEDVESGKDVVAAAGQSFEHIAAAVSDLTQHAETILQDARRSAEKVDALVQVMDGINQSGKDVAAETESVSAATEEQSASMAEIADASRKLSGLAQELTGATAKFKI